VRLEVINPTINSDESPYSNLVTDLTAILYSFMGKLYRIKRGPKKSKTEGQDELKSKNHKATNKPAINHNDAALIKNCFKNSKY